MDVLHRAEQLHTEASEVIQLLHLTELTAVYSPIYPAGSYRLNLLAYPDLDLYLLPLTLPQLFELARRLAECPLVRQIVYEPSRDPSLPDGLYLKPRLEYGSWGRLWKVDIWSIPKEVIQARLAELDHFASLLTPQLRLLILQYKNAMLTPQLRTPMYSGYFIYKAVLQEGLREFDQITHYLLQNGIKI